jgi:hypothetical protein
MRAAPPPWPAADASTPPSELDLDGETGVAAPPPPHAVQRHAMMPFAVRAAPCRCDHGGPGCSFAARPGLDLSGAAHTRCQHCSFRAVEVLGAGAQGCICGCRCACDNCAGAEEEIWSICKGIRYRQRQREDEPETWRPSAAAIRKVRDGEAALVEAAIAADKSLQSLLSVKMRPEPPHGHNDREIWLIERGILYRQCQRQKHADSAPDRRPLWIIVQEVAEQMGIPSSPSP